MKTIAKLLTAALLVACTASALAEVHYVDVNSTNATPPYVSWATAATNIQDAVDAALAGDEIVVTNGIYATGGAGNRVLVNKPLNLRSVNGPQSSIIDGKGNGRCVYLANGASLSGFTLANGYHQAGAGVWCESSSTVVSNCVITGNQVLGMQAGMYHSWGIGGGAYGGTLNNCTFSGNSARTTLSGFFAEAFAQGGAAAFCTLNNCTLSANSARGTSSGSWASRITAQGGGAYSCTLNNCTLSGNSTSALSSGDTDPEVFAYGGGAYRSTLNHCTLSGNSASVIFGNGIFLSESAGGGAEESGLNNCIVYFNTVFSSLEGAYEDDYGYWSSLNHCCTAPDAGGGIPIGNGNITNAPLFVDQASGNFRLQSNSPCINAGVNAFAPAGPDLDGNPRIVGGTVDIGAYEYQSPASMISYAWLQQFNLPINPSTDTADPDSDGVDNYHEWLAFTNPTNRFSSPAQLTIIPSGTNVILTWSTNAVGFTLQSTTHLDSPPDWTTNSRAPVVIGGQNVITNPIAGPQQFYRLVQ